MVKWQITNINTVVYFNVPIKLGLLADKICKDYVISYHPEDFPGLVIYLDKFRISIFRTGSITITGIKKVEDLIPSVDEVRNLLKKYNVNLPEKYKLEIVTSSIIGKFDYDKIDIERMGIELENATYDPERFSAAIVYYNISPDYKVSFNIFKNGTFVGAGFKSEPNMLIQHIDQIVNSFQENIVKKYAK